MAGSHLGYRQVGRQARGLPRFTFTVVLATAAVGILAALAAGAEAQTANQLKFMVPPGTVAAGEPFAPVVKVGVYDSTGNTLVTSGSHTVTLTLSAAQSPANCPAVYAGAMRPCGALLHGSSSGQQGDVTGTTSGGVVSFANLRVDAIGNGYQIVASAPSLTSATSPHFDITPGQMWPEPQRTSARTSAQSFPARMASPTSLPDIGTTPNRPIRASPVVIDLDRDGLLDVVFALDFANTAGGAPAVVAYRQTSPGTFGAYWTYSAFPTLQQVKDGQAVIVAGNVTGDAHPEVLVYWAGFTDAGGSAYISGHDLRVLDGQAGSLIASWAPPGTWVQPAPPALGDVTGDGRPDIVLLHHGVAGTFTRAVQRLAILNLDGASWTTFASGTLPTISYQYCGPGVGVSCTVTGPLAYATAPPVLVEARSGHAGMEVVIGSNGATTPPVYVNGRPPGYVFLCSPVSGSIGCSEQVKITTASASTGTMQSAMVYALAAADLNADGSPDIVVNARYVDAMPPTQQVQALAVVSTSTTPISLASTLGDAYHWNSPALGDMDGDGNPDIANVKWSSDGFNAPRQGDVRVRGLSSSNALVDKGTLTRTLPAGQSSTESRGGALVDLDYASGVTPKLEFAFGSEDRTVAAVSETTAPAPALFWTTSPSTTAVPTTPTVAADLNGDCAPEILVGMANGNLRRLGGSAASAPSVVPDLNVAIQSPWVSPGQGLQAKLHWTAPATDNGMPIIAYRVMRSTSISGPFVEVGTWRGVTPPTPAVPFIDNTLAAEGDYYYVVRAVNCAGLGPMQPNPFWSEVRGPIAPPTVSGSPYGTPAYAASPSPQARITWTQSPPNADAPAGCGDVTGYNIYRSTVSPVALVPANRLNGVPVTSTNYVDTTLGNQLYRYAVAAVNCVGETASEVTVDARLPSDVSPVLSPVGSSIIVSFQPPATIGGCTDAQRLNGWVEGYRIFRGLSPGTATYIGTLLPGGQAATPPTPWRWAPPPLPAFPGDIGSPAVYADAGLTVGTRYYYQVSAVNCVGEGPRSAEVSALAGGSPPPIVATLTPATALGKPAHTFTLSPLVSGGVPPYSCVWSVSPAGAAFTPPTGPSACSGNAVLTGGAPGTVYRVSLQVTDGVFQVVTRTSAVEMAPQLTASLASSPPWGATTTTFTFSPTVQGGLSPRTCTWSIAPAAGVFTPPPAESACTGSATFRGGVLGVTYTVSLTASDGVAPIETVTATLNVQVRENAPPVAVFTITSHAEPTQEITFPESSYDVDGMIVHYQWDFGDGTTSTLRNPSHVYARPGTYHVRLLVIDDKGATGELIRQVTVGFEEEGVAAAGVAGAVGPAVDAGPDLTVVEGTVVRLQGIGPAAALYTWRQAAGPPVELGNPHSATPAFTAPLLGAAPRLALAFTVFGTEAGAEGPADMVTVTVVPGNRAPVAHAGDAREVDAGTMVELEGLGSDPDGDALTYTWSQVGGGVFVKLLDAGQAKARFQAPDLAGELQLQLTVSDGKLAATDTVIILVRAARPADAGFTYTVSADDPLRVTFRARSTAGDAQWDFGDGTLGSGLEVTHTYSEAKAYEASLRLTVDGLEATTSQPVVVAEPKGRLAPAPGSEAPAWAMAALGAGLLLAALGVAALAMRRRWAPPG